MMFGDLFKPSEFEAFVKDQTTNVKTWKSEFSLEIGMWHYAQGAWITCDSAADEEEWGGSANKETLTLCASNNTPHILHSTGIYGEYVWMDLTNKYYGVFVRSWMIDLVHLYWIGTWISLAVAPLIACLCSACQWKFCRCCGDGKDEDEDENESLPSR